MALILLGPAEAARDTFKHFFFPFLDLVYIKVTMPIFEMVRGQELEMLGFGGRHLLADNDNSDFGCPLSSDVVVS